MTVVAPSPSSRPFQVSVRFNCPRDRMALSEVTARQLGHTAAGLSSASVSDQMINVLFVTVSSYINELFIINAHTDTLTDKDWVCAVCKWNMDVGGKFHRWSSMHVYVHFVKFVSGDLITGLTHLCMTLTHWFQERIFFFRLHNESYLVNWEWKFNRVILL